MVLKYLNYDFLDPNEELQKIQYASSAEIILEANNRKCLFILGMLFVNGIKIKIINEKDINLEETNKSFPMMAYVWSKISDNEFPNNNYSNVENEMDNRIENIKRLGVKVDKILDKTIDNKIFLICPVRNASEDQRKWIEDYVEQKSIEGYIIHAPHLHTRQKDLFGGYAICKQNAEAVASSNEIAIYYDKSSTGSVFDLGVAFALQKPLVLLNEDKIEFNETDFVDNLLKNWQYKNESKLKVKSLI